MYKKCAYFLKKLHVLIGFFFCVNLAVGQGKRGMQHLIRIIYVDIDGTLRDEQKGIPNSAIWALGKCREQGIQIAICTGRNPASIQDDVLALHPDGIISGGGCYILYHGKGIYKRHFPYGAVGKILSAAAEWRLALAVETEHKIYMDRDAS